MAFIYFYIFYIFYICLYILLIYLRDILSFAWLTGYATRPVVLFILCIQIDLLRIIIIIIIEFYCMQPYLYSTFRVMLIVKFILLFVIQ